MSIKNKRKLILSGILLIIAATCYALYQERMVDCVSWYFKVGEYFCWDGMQFRSWLGVTVNTIGSVFMVFYCFAPTKQISAYSERYEKFDSWRARRHRNAGGDPGGGG